VPRSASPYIVDTHVWLDLAFGRGRFVPRIHRELEASANAGTLYLAAISCWEVAMLARQGKAGLTGPVHAEIVRFLGLTRTRVAPLDPAIAVDAVELGWDHKDPADRMIVATARWLEAPLVTRDVAILAFAERTHAVRVVEPF
jgi:PIN domain nuclease of toxin-antitoxin system